MKILVAFASAHGSTGEVAYFIGDVLRENHQNVTVAAVKDITSIQQYDVFVLGSAIHNGLWLPTMSKFISHFRTDFQQKPLFIWLSCIRVLEPNGYAHVMTHYLRHEALRNLNVDSITAFAGKLDADGINWTERGSFVSHYDGVNVDANGDFRDWDAISHWAKQIGQHIRLARR